MKKKKRKIKIFNVMGHPMIVQIMNGTEKNRALLSREIFKLCNQKDIDVIVRVVNEATLHENLFSIWEAISKR